MGLNWKKENQKEETKFGEKGKEKLKFINKGWFGYMVASLLGFKRCQPLIGYYFFKVFF